MSDCWVKSSRQSTLGAGVVALVLAAASALASALPGDVPRQPPTPRDNVVETLHGVAVADPYRWLEDLSSARTKGWIRAQQNYTHERLDRRRSLTGLKAELGALERLRAPQTVIQRDGRFVILERRRGRQVASLYERDGLDGRERLLVDAGAVSPNHSTTIDLLNVSANGRLLAYGLRRGGQDQLAIRFYSLDQGRNLPDTLPPARYVYWSLQLSPDGQRAYYIRYGEDGPRLFEHRIGAPPSGDKMLFGDGLGPQIILQANLSADGRLLLIEVLHGANGPTDLYLLHTDRSAPAQSLVKGVDANFTARAAGGRIFVQTDWKAALGRIMVVDEARPDFKNWRELVPQGADPLQGFSLAGGDLVLAYLHDAHSRLAIVGPDGGPHGAISLPGMGTADSIDDRWDSPIVCFGYSSFATPESFYAYSLRTKTRSVISAPTAPAWLSKIVTRQVWYRSGDGTRVPMFLAQSPASARRRDAPVLLHAYGGFGWAQTPTFSPEAAVWIERGGVYALADIRGGGEFGDAWRRAGELDHKQNSFDDFAAAARWLIAGGYARPDRLVIQGKSNGGLLMLVSITQHPELFAAAVARYPLADMLRYQRFGVARWWTSEYGSVDNDQQFRTLLAYSPYQNVTAWRDYPAVLLVTGANDTRVNPAHALKMTAALQHASPNGRPILLLYDSKSGHSGVMPASAEIDQTAHELAFLLWRTRAR